MENIHLILANKAVASLYHCSNTRDFFTTRQTSDDLLYEVYITSDEEIKEKDSFYDLTTKKVFYACKDMLTWRHDTKEKHKNWEKIILTTDQDLIKDGVQAIDDEFLEWFVKNPSCEKVEVKDYPMVEKYNSKGEYIHKSYWVYKIIIPKEEPKMIECYFIPSNNTSSATICGNCGKEKMLHTIGSGIKVSKSVIITKEEPNPFELPKALPDDVFYESLEPKNETLEEAAERFWQNDETMSDYVQRAYITGFITGSKWQQEQAKEMEKGQIMQAYNDGKAAVIHIEQNMSLEEYYDKTYKNETK